MSQVLNSKVLSHLSTDSVDARYQKALKEISKLIAVNRQIKGQTDKVIYQAKNWSEKYNQLYGSYQHLEAENRNLTAALQSVEMKNENMEELYEKLQRQTEQFHNADKDMDIALHQQEQRYEEQIQFLVHKLQEQEENSKNSSDRLQLYIKKLEDEMAVHLEEKKQLQLKHSEMMKNLQQERQQQLILEHQASKAKDQEILKAKISSQDEWISKLSDECTELKKALIQKQVPYPTNQEQIHFIADENAFRSLGLEVQKKIKKSEREKNQYIEKYHQVKTKLKQVEAKLHHYKQKEQQIKEQTLTYTQKLQGYERLTVKQQKQIEKMIANFDAEAKRVMERQRTLKVYEKDTELINEQKVVRETSEYSKKEIETLSKEVEILDKKVQQFSGQVLYWQEKCRAYEQEVDIICRINEELSRKITGQGSDPKKVKVETIHNGHSFPIVYGSGNEVKYEVNQNVSFTPQNQLPKSVVSMNYEYDVNRGQTMENYTHVTSPKKTEAKRLSKVYFGSRERL